MQPIYLEKVLDCHIILEPKTAKVSMQDTISHLYDTLIPELRRVKYLTKVDSIIYIIFETYINIDFATSMVNQFAKNPSLGHFI